MEDYKKAIETLETTPEEEMINTEEDDELLQETDQIDDLTISTVGLEESSDIVLDIPTFKCHKEQNNQIHPCLLKPRLWSLSSKFQRMTKLEGTL